MKSGMLAILLLCSLGYASRMGGQQTPPIPGQQPPELGPTKPAISPEFIGPEKKVEPGKRPFDSARAQREAKELALLADGIPPEVNDLSKGVLPKDLLERVKKIEKLAKQLRKQISS